MSDTELTNQEKQFLKKRIMLKATIFAFAIVITTVLFGILMLNLIK